MKPAKNSIKEITVRQERKRIAAIVANFADGLILIEKNKLVLLNRKARELLGVCQKDVAGQTLGRLKKKSVLFKTLIELLQRKGPKLKKLELSWGQDLVVEVSTTPILGRGKQTGIIVTLHDVTREKVIERMKTEFVSIAAHQLRTPLSVIKWILKMFLEGDLGKLNSLQREFLDKAYHSNERMIRLINDLLNVARIEEGRFLHKISKEDIIRLITRRVEMAKVLARQKGLQLVLKKPKKKVPQITMDVEKISLAVQNLLDNAIHYSKKGRITVSIGYLSRKKEIIFSIKDPGIGIPKDQEKRVFSKFFRGANAVKEETEGTGLGLFIAKNIIEAHKGRIWFESKENKGTAFYFVLPLKNDKIK